MKTKALSILLALLLTLTACGASTSAVGAGAVAPSGQRAAVTLSAETDGFSDVPADADYAQAVEWCREEGLMGGVGGDRFDPEGVLTRATLATVLYRAEKAPAVTAAPNFPDAKAGTWYSDAVVWAHDRGIILGYGNGLFGVNDPVSVEQLEVILGRYTGSGPEWVGDPAKAHAATRAQVAVAHCNALKHRTENPMKQITLTFNGHTYTATLEKNAAVDAFVALLRENGGSITISAGDYGGWEKVGPLGQALPCDDVQTTTSVGDFVLYSGDQIVLFYGSNSWSYTRLGRINDPGGLREALGDGDVDITFRLADGEGDTGPFDLAAGQVTLNSGYVMPINGLGTYSLTGDECINSVKAALESGVRLIDTAYMYHNEAEVGRAIRESGVPREEIFVITKLYPGSQYADPEQAIRDALDKLDIGYIDMMLLHHPGENDVKAYQAMEQAVADGKIRSIGLSNWYVEELEEFLPQVTITPALVQNEIHPYYQENDVIPYIQDLGIVVQGWYPLGGRGHTAELLGDETISAIAAAHGVSSAQVILRWNLQKGVFLLKFFPKDRSGVDGTLGSTAFPSGTVVLTGESSSATADGAKLTLDIKEALTS